MMVRGNNVWGMIALITVMWFGAYLIWLYLQAREEHEAE